MAELKDFSGMEGSNFFELDPGLASLLKSLAPPAEHDRLFASLGECGALAAGRWDELAREGSRHEQLPSIIKFDRVGNPVERVDFGAATRQLRSEVADFGVLSAGHSRLHKFALLYLISHNGEGSLTCPISCTDGLIESIEAQGSEFLRETYLPLLRSVEIPFGGAQFVTEKAGGSDVGAIEAEASPESDGTWSIIGDKWFCSNPDEFYLVAARLHGAERPGTKGIGIFLVPRVLPDGQLNGISFLRLKNKMGTQSLPTAEMVFDGATAFPIGDPEEGFKTLMHYVINVSRVHNSTSALGIQRRAFLEARNYANQREAFGHTLSSYPLIQETLVTLLDRLWRGRVLTFNLIAMLDQNGLTPKDTEQGMWQRFLINLAKYRTAQILTRSVQEAILILGANGIVEDFSVLPRLLRDSMVVETWEGPHNTLCLQIMRDAARSNLLDRWRSEISQGLERWPDDFLAATRASFDKALAQTDEIATREWITESGLAETHARRLVDRLGSLLETVWMVDFARGQSDTTAALLTSVAVHDLFPPDDPFDHHFHDIIANFGVSLVAEEPIQTDVSSY